MITAQQARELAGPSVDEYLEHISSLIEKEAKEKRHELIIRSEPYGSWLYPSYEKAPKVAKDVINKLNSNGFQVSLYYQELQFVDMGLWIKW
jgi:hypothetical protein